MIGAPAYRKGWVVKALAAKGCEAITPAQRISRTASEARALGIIISERTEDYLAELSQSIYMHCASKGSRETLGNLVSITRPKRPDELEEFTKAKFSPGLILDLPTLRISTNRFVIDVRHCLTICLNDNQSKIWARFALRELDGEPAFEMSAADIDKFHTSCQKISSKSLKCLSNLYRDDFKGLAGREIIFDTFGELNFFVLDSDLNGNAEELKTVSRKIISGEIDRNIHEEDVAKALRIATNSVNVGSRDNSRTADFQLKDRSANFVSQSTSSGKPAVFVVHARGKRAFFTGIAANLDSSELDSKLQELNLTTFSNGLSAMTRLAVDVARNF